MRLQNAPTLAAGLYDVTSEQRMMIANPFSLLSDAQLDELVGRLTKSLCPSAIYLFGSHAVGVPTPDSDIDLMVIVEDEPATVEHHKRGRACLQGLGLPVELHICSRERFERFAGVIGSLQHDIQRKGVLLYAAET